MNESYFYHDKPIFGIDIGFSNFKLMQINWQGKRQVVTGYGVSLFDSSAIVDGVIIDHEAIAKSAYELFDNHLVGDINTRRVVLSVPAARTFTRSITLPALKDDDIYEAVKLETEQYVPVPLNDLYVDYEIISKSPKQTEILVVAIPKNIVDSYVQLTNILGLELIAIEPTIAAASRLFKQAEANDVPTVLIDLGSLSSDITIYDNGLIVTGTVASGGDSFTQAIAKKLSVTEQEAHIIKTKYGLGLSKKQKELTDCLTPILAQMLKEIKRMIRYYEERSGTDKKINQVVTMGGGANMPGLSEYMTDTLRLAVRMCDPWQHLDFKNLPKPNAVEKSMFVTVAGLALTDSKEIFK